MTSKASIKFPVEEISIKTLFERLVILQTQIEQVTKLAPIVTQNEKDIIRLVESHKHFVDRLEDVEKDVKGVNQLLKESQSQNQKILIFIGAAAIIAQVVFQLLFPHLL